MATRIFRISLRSRPDRARTLQAGRFPTGTIFDPATTQQLPNGQYVREPFAGNIIPASRLDPNAVKLAQPVSGAHQARPVQQLQREPGIHHRTSTRSTCASTRTSHPRINCSAVSVGPAAPSFLAGSVYGVADDGGFRPATRRGEYDGGQRSVYPTLAHADQRSADRFQSRVHLARSSLRQRHLQHSGAVRYQGILQTPGNGGLPYFGIGGLSQLGSSEWLVSDRYSNTLQFTENLTKTYRSHTFKGGFEAQEIKFPWIAPPYSREASFQRTIHLDTQNLNDSSTGRTQFLLAPSGAAQIGGANQVDASNFGGVAAQRSYRGAYVQDDWKVYAPPHVEPWRPLGLVQSHW